MKIAAILLSRQALRPCRHTSWVRQTLNAIKWVKQNHLCLCTSLGIQTWEFLIYLAQSREIMQRVLIPAKNDQEFDQIKNSVTNQFGLDPPLVRFRSIIPTNSQIGREELMAKRDRAAVFESDILIPVSIRAKGHMEKLILEKSSKKEGMVNWEFQIKYHKREHPLAYHINTRDLPH